MSRTRLEARPLVLSAPSGAGKTTIARKLVDEEEDAVLAHVLMPTVPERLSRIIARLMMKRPDDRHADGGELIEDLRSLLADLGADPDAPPRPAAAPPPDAEEPHQEGKIRKFRSKLNDVFKPFKWTEVE